MNLKETPTRTERDITMIECKRVATNLLLYSENIRNCGRSVSDKHKRRILVQCEWWSKVKVRKRKILVHQFPSINIFVMGGNECSWVDVDGSDVSQYFIKFLWRREKRGKSETMVTFASQREMLLFPPEKWRDIHHLTPSLQPKLYHFNHHREMIFI